MSAFSLATYAAAVAAPLPESDASPGGPNVAYDEDFLALKAQIDARGTLSGRIDQARVASGDDLYQPCAGPDYAAIAAQGRRILTERSKDLRTACYVALALQRAEGFPGLAAGLEGVQALTTSFWDALHPPPHRTRGRRAILAFLLEALRDGLPNDPSAGLSAGDAAALRTSLRVLTDLDASWNEKLGDEAPSPGSLLRRLERLHRTARALDAPKGSSSEPHDSSGADPPPPPDLPPPEGSGLRRTDPRPAPAPAAEPAAAPDGTQNAGRGDPAGPAAASGPDETTGDAATSPSRSSPGAEPRAEASKNTDALNGTDAFSSKHRPDERGDVDRSPESLLLRAAGELRSASATDARPYRLIRVLRWDSLLALPPNEEGRTRIPPPSAQRRSALTAKAAREDPAALIDRAEDAFQAPPFHFWLDLQLALADAMERHGRSFAAARQVVCDETLRLVRRLPALVTLRFSDDTPFASDATRRWTDALARRDGPADAPENNGPAGSVPPSASPLDPLRQACRRLPAVARSDGLDAAVSLLQSAGAEDRSPRTTFRIRLAVAEALLEAGRVVQAGPILNALIDEGEARDLSRWEPRLFARAWAGLYLCGQRHGPPGNAAPLPAPTWRRRAREAHDRVCALDPPQALQLPPPPPSSTGPANGCADG